MGWSRRMGFPWPVASASDSGCFQTRQTCDPPLRSPIASDLANDIFSAFANDPAARGDCEFPHRGQRSCSLGHKSSKVAGRVVVTWKGNRWSLNRNWFTLSLLSSGSHACAARESQMNRRKFSLGIAFGYRYNEIFRPPCVLVTNDETARHCRRLSGIVGSGNHGSRPELGASAFDNAHRA